MTSKRRRHNPEQIIRKLQDAEKLQAQGHDVAAIARELGVTEATYYRWKNQYGGLKAEDAKRLKELEKQNDRLKRLLADLGTGSQSQDTDTLGRLLFDDYE